MTNRSTPWIAALWLACALVGCDAEASPDAAVTEDSGAGDSGAADSSAGDSGASDSGAGLPDTCEAECAALDLVATFGATTETFERAQLGFTYDAGAIASLRIEAHAGGDPACPTMSSPSPDRTLIVAALPVPLDASPLTPSGVSLLDFAGTLTTAPIARATSVTITPVAVRTEPAADAFVAFDLDATFADGTIRGRVYATHCDSLDL